MAGPPPVDSPDDEEIWFREDQDEAEYLERISDLEEQLTRQILANEQLSDRLRRERKERDSERREDSRWYATQRTAVMSIAVVVVVAVLGSILFQISSLNSKLRDKGERLAKVEERLSPALTSSDLSTTITSSDTAPRKQRSDPRPPIRGQ